MPAAGDTERDEFETFALLTLDCLALSRAMREKVAPIEDELERARRRRLVQRIEAAIRAG
jgi:hypothetical protein